MCQCTYLNAEELATKAQELAELLTQRGYDVSVLPERSGESPKLRVINMTNGHCIECHLDDDGGFGWEAYGASPEEEPRSCTEIADLLSHVVR